MLGQFQVLCFVLFCYAWEVQKQVYNWASFHLLQFVHQYYLFCYRKTNIDY